MLSICHYHMASLNTLKITLATDIETLRKKLLPFDSVFDEDALIATEEMHCIIVAELEKLKVLTGDILSVPEISERLGALMKREQMLANAVEKLKIKRQIAHTTWKEEYMLTLFAIAPLETKLQKIVEVEKSITETVREVGKNPRDVFMWARIHSHVNSLLTVAGHKKKTHPIAALQSAKRESILDDVTYNALCK